MASEKTDLTRAGTMEVTAQTGKAFLAKNLTEWKKPYLMDQFEDDDDDQEEEDEEETPKAKKPKMSKNSTMKGTAKEAEALLGDSRPDTDAGTRGQQKKIDAIKAETPKAKKAKMAREGTMAGTAKEGKALVGTKLGDTRQESKKRKSTSSLKRASTVAQCKAEAEAVFGKLEQSEGRSLRKRPQRAAAKPQLKKAGTMVKTAKEGKAYLKRQKK